MNDISGFLLLFATQSPLGSRVVNGLFDDSFSGIYRLSAFDWLLLVPYFSILLILSVYGVHRYETIRRYRRYKQNLPSVAPSKYEVLPRVTVQLPLFNERYVVERLLDEITKLDYPRELLQVQVLDDSTDETHAFTERLCNEYRATGFPVEYRHRTNRHGYKAGALQEGLETATGDLIAIFDADFTPPADFLRRTVDYFVEPDVGVVQTRWSYLNKEFNILTQVEAMLLDGHFVLEHGARCGSGLFFNFNGTAGILRRRMIDDAGGWQHETLTEDSDLSYRAQLKGWRFVYVPGVECPSELPVETYGFQVQQARWAKGLTQVALKLLPRILKADLPFRVKAEAFMHLTPNISYPLMLIVSMLMFYMGMFQMVLIDFPLIVASFWSISAFYLYAQRELFPKSWVRSIAFLPMLMAAGIALTVSNAKGVIEALLGVQTSFARTAKFAIGGHVGENRKTQRKPVSASYKRKSGWLPYVELGIGSYFVYMVSFAIDTMNYLAVPFLMLFVCGYLWAGISTLFEEYRDKLEWQRARRLAEVR